MVFGYGRIKPKLPESSQVDTRTPEAKANFFTDVNKVMYTSCLYVAFFTKQFNLVFDT